MKIERQPVMNGRNEVGVADRRSLRLRYGDKRSLIEIAIERGIGGQILAPMQRGYGSALQASKQWEMQVVDMEVQHVELFGDPHDHVQHDHVVGNGIVRFGL